jgi:hypothetical protein
VDQRLSNLEEKLAQALDFSSASSVDQRLRNPEEKLAQPLTFHPNMHRCASAMSALCKLAFGVLSSLVLAGVFVRAVRAVCGCGWLRASGCVL